ncbi:hypothetical protein [Amycolatopsis rubida]|uniref:hypothetical protein n=1 Tax=Amycolatopsis rubida TaxID=112413 RepID=UPI001FCAD88A|nr:hypothetical protein [Amycolatopsis rubida]
MRAPYRARLGFLLGHVGRETGARGYAVLEVIGHPDRDIYVAQWYRSLVAEPWVRVDSGASGLCAQASGRVARVQDGSRKRSRHGEQRPSAPSRRWPSCAWTVRDRESGAGIAGSAAAQCPAPARLGSRGLERASAPRPPGYPLGFPEPGRDAAEAVGILPRLRKPGVPVA